MTLVPALPPNHTSTVPVVWNAVPVSVTIWPPCAVPLEGDTPVTVGDDAPLT